MLGNISPSPTTFSSCPCNTYSLSSSVMVTTKKKETGQARQRPHTLQDSPGASYIYVILPTLPEQEQLIDGAGVLV
jgi:hypothetical protein